MLTLNDGRDELWQWDTGRKLTVDADCTQVHFSNKVFGRSVDVDVFDGTAEIPDVLLQVDKDLLVWAFVGTAENGYTKISKTFKVNKRNKPADYVFTPLEQTTLQELVERLDAIEESQDPDAIKNAVEDYLKQNPVESPVQSVNGYNGKVVLTAEDVGAISKDDLQKATNEALAQAKASGEFDGKDGVDGQPGKDGYTPQKGIDYFDGQPGKDGVDGKDGYTPVKGVDYFDGNPGKDGVDGKDGSDGYTPVKGKDYFDGNPGADGADGVTPHIGSNGNWFVGNTDTGKPSRGADGQPGKDGADGAPGEKGDKGDKGDTGATGAQGNPGKDGVNGKDGTSATHSWNGTVLTITSASGTSSADLKGTKGDKGDKGDTGATGATGKNGSDANVTAQNIASALGYTPANESAVNSLSSNQSALSARMDAFTALGEGSTTGDAELMDARVDCEGKTWANAGGHIRGITEKIIDACCDREVISGGNYNLFKMSEVSYSSRLQNDVAGIVSSTNGNAVTGWIPVEYGKYYCGTVLIGGTRVYGHMAYQRLNLKLSDGTIIVYNKGSVPHTADGSFVIRIEYENAVAMMLHFSITDSSGEIVDINTPALLEAYKPMIVEGNNTIDAQTKATTYEYIDGDAEVPGEVNYTLKRDDTKINKVSLSPYYRNANFGVIPFTYYQGLSDSYANAGFTKNTTYATFIAAWKTLVVNHGGYVTETELGKASDGQSIYLYDFKPVRITNQNKPIPKIIIIAGQHGFEKSNIFGLYHFVDNLLNKWTQHPALEYLRNNVELMIVPVLNTYGFDTLEYKNANGVNTNRNFDSNWSLVADTTSPQYGGAEPFDQPETQIVRDLILDNDDAVMAIDFHTNGGTSVTKYEDVNWCALVSSADSYYNRMLDAVAHHLSAVTAHFNSDYELNQPDVMMGHVTLDGGVGKLRNWATDNNFIGVLIEGFNGFPNSTEFSNEVFKANEEIIVNYLITALNYLSK